MPAYDYRCPDGHHIEQIFKMADVPETVECDCGLRARRMYCAPAAIHFKGPGFYATDVRSKLHRKRRKNPGDDLYTEFDTDAARIARAI